MYRLGKYQEAIISYDKALQLNPNIAVLWSNKGDALKRLGDFEEARKCFEKGSKAQTKLMP